MNKKMIVTAMMAVFMTVGSSAFADNDNHRNDRGRDSHSQRDHHRGHDDDRHDHRGKKHSSHHDNGHHNGRGAGPRHNYYKGGYVSREYRQRQYVVNDWRGHHLHAPPRGYHWVQTGPDYVLIAIGTGLIAQIVLSN